MSSLSQPERLSDEEVAALIGRKPGAKVQMLVADDGSRMLRRDDEGWWEYPPYPPHIPGPLRAQEASKGS